MQTDLVDYTSSGLRWQTSALLALQEATEAFLVHLFEDAYVIVLFLHVHFQLTCSVARAGTCAPFTRGE